MVWITALTRACVLWVACSISNKAPLGLQHANTTGAAVSPKSLHLGKNQENRSSQYHHSEPTLPFSDKWGSPKGHWHLPAIPRTPLTCCPLRRIVLAGRLCCKSPKVKKSLQRPISAIIGEVRSLTDEGKNTFCLPAAWDNLSKERVRSKEI